MPALALLHSPFPSGWLLLPLGLLLLLAVVAGWVAFLAARWLWRRRGW